MAKGLEAGFRNRFPFDYLIELSWTVQLFEKHGFQEDEYSRIDAGTDCPGIKMIRGNEKVEIFLVSPLDENYSIKVDFKNYEFSIEIPAYECEKSSLLLENLLGMNFGKYKEEKK